MQSSLDTVNKCKIIIFRTNWYHNNYSKSNLEEYVRKETPEQASDDAIVGGGDGTTDYSKSHLKVVSSTNILTLSK